MTDIGEAITVPEFLNETHNENTCPWHTKEKPATTTVMEEQAPNEDTDLMPANLGEKLGKNLGEKENGEVWIEYRAGALLKYNMGVKKKEVASYINDEENLYCYALQYAPHHLIPGNESLKGSKVVPFLGDTNAIGPYKKGLSSKIKDGQSVNYDVNRAENGVWLPSPYALSMSNQWPSLPGIEVVKKRLGQEIANQTENFKHAYVAEAIKVAGNHQFHMRHLDYSNEVRKILDAIGEKLKLFASSGDCPIAASSKKDDKFDAPMGLQSRLDLLSGNLRQLLTGRVWRAPMYADENLMTEYIKSLSSLPGAKGDMVKVI